MLEMKSWWWKVRHMKWKARNRVKGRVAPITPWTTTLIAWVKLLSIFGLSQPAWWCWSKIRKRKVGSQFNHKCTYVVGRVAHMFFFLLATPFYWGIVGTVNCFKIPLIWIFLINSFIFLIHIFNICWIYQKNYIYVLIISSRIPNFIINECWKIPNDFDLCVLD